MTPKWPEISAKWLLLVLFSKDNQGLRCPVLLAKLSSEEEEETRRVKCNYMYGTVDRQKDLVNVMTKLLEIRANLLKPTSGATLDASEQ